MPSATLQGLHEHPEILRPVWLPSIVAGHEKKNLQKNRHIEINKFVDFGTLNPIEAIKNRVIKDRLSIQLYQA